MITILCDGTSNGLTDENPTNIRKIRDALHAQGQQPLYFAGPGDETNSSWLGEILGSAFGLDCDIIVGNAMMALKAVHHKGDQIAIFGFSRGATIARMLASKICEEGVNGYHTRVKFLGCFDTVAAFLPFGAMQQGYFHNLHVNAGVDFACHAVSLDEDRAAFAPNLMNRRDGVTEVWFRGNHCGVGGGYENSGLSDISLGWMLNNAIHHGLAVELETHPNRNTPIMREEWPKRRMRRTPVVLVGDEVSNIQPDIHYTATMG